MTLVLTVESFRRYNVLNEHLGMVLLVATIFESVNSQVVSLAMHFLYIRRPGLCTILMWTLFYLSGSKCFFFPSFFSWV